MSVIQPRGGFKIASFVQSAKSASSLLGARPNPGTVSEIGSPENFKHHLHVDTDFTWSGNWELGMYLIVPILRDF
jgi:hypothetical protein